MGLLKKFKNNKKQDNEKLEQESNLLDNADSSAKEEDLNKEKKAKLVIKHIFTIANVGCAVDGILDGNKLHKDDSIYIFRQNGKVLTSKVNSIDLPEGGFVEYAEPGDSVGLILDGISTDEISVGDTIVSISGYEVKSSNSSERIKTSENEESVKKLKDGIVDETRRAELGFIIFSDTINEKMLAELTIQECIYIFKSLQHFNSQSPIENYENKVNVVFGTIIDKLKSLDVTYVLFDKATKLPFIGTRCAEVYSTKFLAEKAVDHYAENYRNLYVEEFQNNKENSENIYAVMYYLGIEDVLVDNGAYGLKLERKMILPPPDWSSLGEENVPVINPEVRFAICEYLEEARWAVDYEGREEALNQKEKEMISKLKEGTYIVAVEKSQDGKKSENDDLTVSLMKTQEGDTFIPAFTDYIELQKVYGDDNWDMMVFPLKAIIDMAKNNNGVVVNPFSENLVITSENAKEIF